MVKSFLEKLELAYQDLSEKKTVDARERYLVELEKEDSKLAAELRQITDHSDPGNGINISAVSFLSLEEVELGDDNGYDSYGELVELLKLVRPSRAVSHSILDFRARLLNTCTRCSLKIGG